jgi:hypothetical protein
MAGRRLALTESARALSQSPAKKKKRSGRGKRNAPQTPALGPEWSELEQAFFAAAPPEEPQSAAEPELFDDLLELAPSRRQPVGAARRALAVAGAALRRLLFGAAPRPRSASRR